MDQRQLDAPWPDVTPWPDLTPWPDVKPWPDLTPPGELCGNGTDDDSDGQIDCIDLDCHAKPPCTGAARALVLHEVFPGTVDYIVLRNASTVAQNTAGYTLEMQGTGPVYFTLPAKTLQPGQRVAIFEYSSGLTGDINTGDNIPFYNGLVGAYANAAVLRTPGGVVADYVGFGDALPGLPAGASQVGGPVSYVNYDATTQSHYRAEMQGAWPTFHTSDWVVYTKSR